MHAAPSFSDVDATDPGFSNIRCSEVWGGNRAIETRLVLPGLQGCVIARPYKRADSGGDVHLVSSCGTGRITRLMLADVAGHGDEAAETGDRLRHAMLRYMNHITPHALAKRMNLDMSRISENSGRFATAIILTYFSPDGSLSLCNAGHPPPLIYRAATKTWSAIDQVGDADAVRNLPLGVLDSAGYIGRETKLSPGDVLIIYTDALNEARNTDGQLLGVPGLIDAAGHLASPADGTPMDPARCSTPDLPIALIRHIEELGYMPDDDLTIVTLRCHGQSEGQPPAQKVGGVLRALATFVTRRPIPFPELTWKNLGGSLFKAKTEKSRN